MRAPSYNIPGVDRRSGMSEYQPVPSQMPTPPSGFQWVAVPGQIFPQLQKLPTTPFQWLGAAALLAGLSLWGYMIQSGKKVSLPIAKMP
jgi:hypothetical protein